MKISKTQLKQIIKEEHSRLVNETSAEPSNVPKKIKHSDPASVGGSGQSGRIPPESSFREDYTKFKSLLTPIWDLYGTGVKLKPEVLKIIGLAQTTRQDTEARREMFINTLKSEFENIQNVFNFLSDPRL